MNRGTLRNRRLRMELMESRQMMAGDVTVTLAERVLHLHGDRQSNSISIVETAPGKIEITGLDGTTINGASTPFNAEGSNVNLVADMGNGDDCISISVPINPALIGTDGIVIGLPITSGGSPFDPPPPRFFGAASLRMGNGNDTVEIARAAYATSFAIDTASGNDTVVLSSNAPMPGSVLIRTGNGDDVVVAGLHTDGNLEIDTGAGNDSVGVGQGVGGVLLSGRGAIVGGNLVIRTGDGDDLVGVQFLRGADNVRIDTGAGADTINVGYFDDQLHLLSPLSVPFASPAAILVMRDVAVDQSLTIFGGEGNNQIKLASVQAHFIRVHTGGGNDSVSLVDCAADVFFAWLGRGNDTLDTSAGMNLIDQLFAFGGPGVNTFLNAEVYQFRRLRLFGF